MLALVVEREADEPVYEQIARQVRGAIAAGELPPGQVLPPVRRLASDLGVNLNTVARAYRLLEAAGFVRIRERDGVEVAAPPPRPDPAGRERGAGLLREALERLRQAGLGPDDLRRLVEGEIARMDPAAPAGSTHRR